MGDSDRQWVSVGEAARMLPGVGETKVREFADQGLLRLIRLPSGHRRIEVASLAGLARVLGMPIGPERDAAMDELRLRNRTPQATGFE